MKSIRGVSTNADLDPALIQRDVRPLRYRIADFLKEHKGAISMMLGVLIAIAPHVGVEILWMMDIIVVISPLLFLYAKGKKKEYPYRRPIFGTDSNYDYNNGGMFILGNELDSDSLVAFSNSDIRTHMLVFGSTGSGKTRFLLSLVYQTILTGAGCMYVDGKGDTTVFWLLFSLCRRVGREDDLLVVNYLTGGDSKTGKEEGNFERISNTSNLLAHGSAEQLRSLLVGLMREAGGDGAMWKGRASAFMKGLLNVMVYLRDTGELTLSVDSLPDYMPLDRVIELFQREDIPQSTRLSLHRYLGQLPGFNEEDVAQEGGQLNPEAYKQHGFILMQLTEVISDLSDTYGHIFNADLGEVSFTDVVFNRRILFCMLPALEKDPDALAGLGKLVVAGVRSALAPALGSAIEGTKNEVIDAKPTNARVPFFIICDEYGYYSVKGFAVVAAQARSLGVCVVFAGQDYPSFKKESAEEAASTVANTNIKCCMKLEDPKETADLFISRADDADVSMTSGHSREKTMGYTDTLGTRIEKRKRVSIRDLVDQPPGQSHIIFGDKLVRAQFLYIDPIEVNDARLNHFVMVKKPDDSIIKKLNDTHSSLNDFFSNEERVSMDDKEVEFDSQLSTLFKDMDFAANSNKTLLQSAIHAAGMITYRDDMKTLLRDMPAPEAEDVETETETQTVEQTDKDRLLKTVTPGNSISDFDDDLPDLGDDEPEDDKPETTSEEERSEDDSSGIGINPDLITAHPEPTRKPMADTISASFEDLLIKSMHMADKGILPNANFHPEDLIRTVDGDEGDSKSVMNQFAGDLTYPEQPKPKKKSADLIREKLKSYLDLVENKEVE